jgi:hypothetical protein
MKFECTMHHKYDTFTAVRFDAAGIPGGHISLNLPHPDDEAAGPTDLPVLGQFYELSLFETHAPARPTTGAVVHVLSDTLRQLQGAQPPTGSQESHDGNAAQNDGQGAAGQNQAGPADQTNDAHATQLTPAPSAVRGADHISEEANANAAAVHDGAGSLPASVGNAAVVSETQSG